MVVNHNTEQGLEKSLELASMVSLRSLCAFRDCT